MLWGERGLKAKLVFIEVKYLCIYKVYITENEVGINATWRLCKKLYVVYLKFVFTSRLSSFEPTPLGGSDHSFCSLAFHQN